MGWQVAAEWDALDLAIDTATRVRDWAKWFIFILVPGLSPPYQSVHPPSWFQYTYKDQVWKDNLDSDNRPTLNFCKYFIRAVWNYFLHKITQQWEDAIGALQRVLTSALGSLRHGYGTWSDWVEGIYARVGQGALTWADDLLQAANRLYLWLPEGVRQGLHSWEDIFVYWYGQAKLWVVQQFGSALAAAVDAWAWVVSSGEALRAWYDSVRTWVLDWAQNAAERVRGVLGATWNWIVAFRADPLGTITFYLGPAWAKLVSWADGPLTFYYNLWGSYATMLGEFLADPLGWLYDRTEEELVRRW